MILFREDWQYYPTAIVDYNTTNKSAIILAQKLKIVGVENNLFFLALHNPELQGVDPFSPYLSLEQMAAIGIEIKNNPWYFFREIAKAPAIAGNQNSPIELNRANVALWWSFFNHITFLLVQPRQTGKSFSTDLLMELLYGFRCNNTQINLLTKDDKLRAENIKRLKDIYDELPPYLMLKSKTDSNNTEELSIKALGNSYKTHVPNASPKNALKAARGMTSPIFQIDEPPFQPNIDLSMPAALGAMGAAVDKAKLEGEPYGVILTTTAGKKDEKEGAYVYDNYVVKSAPWSDKFYDAKDAKELEAIVRRNAPYGGRYQIYAEFSHRQLGKTDAWLKEVLERTNSTGDAANRDFFNVWTSGTSSSPLPTWILESLNKSVRDKEHEQIAAIGGYILRWYVPEREMKQYLSTRKMVIGVDTSDASGGDDMSVVMTDVQSGAVVAVGSFNETNLINFARFLVYLLQTFTNATMIIERRSSAITIIDFMLEVLPQYGIDPFKRLFNWVVNEPFEHKERNEEFLLPMTRRSPDLYVRAKKAFGFATSGSGETSRTSLYSTTLLNAMKRCHMSVRDKQLTEQLTGLVTKNGRVDHADGKHDDLVISYMLTHWFLTMAKNLHQYGIESSEVLIEAQVKRVSTDEDRYNDIIQSNLRHRITTLFDLLTDEYDEYVCGRYEQELRALDRQLILRDGENFSIDAFMNSVKDKKKQSRIYTPNAGAYTYAENLGYRSTIDTRYLDENTIVC